MPQTSAIITDRMLATLEAGVVPWHKLWEQGIPRNLVSGKPYRGINVFLTVSAGGVLALLVVVQAVQSAQGQRQGWREGNARRVLEVARCRTRGRRSETDSPVALLHGIQSGTGN
jgi:N-terminal domain of anti-restriction factor ArdC